MQTAYVRNVILHVCGPMPTLTRVANSWLKFCHCEFVSFLSFTALVTYAACDVFIGLLPVVCPSSRLCPISGSNTVKSIHLPECQTSDSLWQSEVSLKD